MLGKQRGCHVMTEFTPISATIGGILIGLSAVWLMAASGRIAGISGIVGGGLAAEKGDRLWRVTFIAGLLLGPILVGTIYPEFLNATFKTSGVYMILAGILVGWGTRVGNGCTSGHGVCGNARLSMRSILATLMFMTTGILTVFTMRYFGAIP